MGDENHSTAITPDGRLSGGSVLTGFELLLAELFQRATGA